MYQTINNNLARTPLLVGGAPLVCKVWLQSQLERDWSLWRGGATMPARCVLWSRRGLTRDSVYAHKPNPSVSFAATSPTRRGDLQTQKVTS